MTSSGPRVLMVAPAPVLLAKDHVTLDAKFLEGMRVQANLWPGRFDCLLRTGATEIPFGARDVDPGKEPFGLILRDAHDALQVSDLQGYDIVICSADDDRNLSLASLVRAAGARLVASLEYTLETRLQILYLSAGRSTLRKHLSAARLIAREYRRRRLLKQADALQANGYPAYALCQRFDPQSLLYLDNRMSAPLFATESDMAKRKARLQSDAPLRLVFSGRLELMKGVQDLVPVAHDLRQAGVAFSLDIFGTGSLRSHISSQISQLSLGAHVHLRAPLDFETELVPYLRRNADVYLCCHKQSDPSCTYIENMGCGLAVAGYGNRMWVALAADSGGGWVSAAPTPKSLAETVAAVSQDREGLYQRCEKALSFARRQDFDALSQARSAHLLAQLRD